MGDWTTTLIIGAVALAAAVAAYFRSPDKWIFPVVLALVGVVLCGANAVSAKLPDGTIIQITGKLADSTDANYQQIQAQQAAIDKLSQGLDAAQAALTKLAEAAQQQALAVKQTAAAAPVSVDGAPAAAAPPPAAVAANTAAATAADQAAPEIRRFEATRIDLGALIDKSRVAGSQAMVANRSVQSEIARLRAGAAQ